MTSRATKPTFSVVEGPAIGWFAKHVSKMLCLETRPSAIYLPFPETLNEILETETKPLTSEGFYQELEFSRVAKKYPSLQENHNSYTSELGLQPRDD